MSSSFFAPPDISTATKQEDFFSVNLTITDDGKTPIKQFKSLSEFDDYLAEVKQAMNSVKPAVYYDNINTQPKPDFKEIDKQLYNNIN
jgi:hypothetical protein